MPNHRALVGAALVSLIVLGGCGGGGGDGGGGPGDDASLDGDDGHAPMFAGAKSIAQVGDGSVLIKWDAASDAVTPASKIVYRVTQTVPAKGVVRTTASGALETTIDGLAPGTYSFVVNAVNEFGVQDTNTKTVTITLSAGDAAVDAGTDAGADVLADTGSADTLVATDSAADDALDSTAVDSTTADTTATDTFVPDTAVADTFVPDTFVADTAPVDTYVPPPTGCSASVTVGESYSSGMYGCAGSVTWASRASLCGAGYRSCTAADWIARRGGKVPGHDYWTSDQLKYSGTGTAACSVSLTTGSTCGSGDRPMRVCSAATDPEGNTCTWTDCGSESTSPDLYFGGCVTNPTAGALCCTGVPGCAAGVTVSEPFSAGMYGCAGSVAWASRGSLCAVGYHSCTAAEWVSGRGAAAPTHNYWTNDQLLYSGTGSGACWVSLTTGSTCGTGDRPMRVCGAATDPEGNTCTWTGCGEGAATPNQYFGGCITNPTAGSLCCPGGTVPTDTTPPVFSGSPSVAGVFADTVASTQHLSVTWTAATDAVSPATDIRYELCWGTGTGCAGGGFSAMMTTAYGATSATITGLTSNQTYNVYVRAQDFAGNTETGNHSGSAKTAMSYSTFIGTGIFNASPTVGGCNGGCHSPLWSRTNTVGVGACGGTLIVAGTPASSIIYLKMSGSTNPCGGGQMPPTTATTGPDPARIADMRTWILEGAHDN